MFFAVFEYCSVAGKGKHLNLGTMSIETTKKTYYGLLIQTNSSSDGSAQLDMK
ncbi:hypothetical protein PVAP13_4KG104300 [Panicum virgatum]|uniref:Uncharacterized protein n=1 Tax=Panicum virgatum TaxID=38727 RepID=A0A8T0TL32_PANVG|nr:hypothetical protein PVAP13_4KG104300 [Panicum virgatum]